jgi:DNA-binding transcriptional MerR regulator
MTPSALARLVGVSTDTLRHYERLGLLAPIRSSSGYRRYSQDDVGRVQLIRRALTIGFSLVDLARVLHERNRGGAPCRQVHALVSARLAAIDGELAALAALKADLRLLLDDWDRRLAATPPGAQARLLDFAHPAASPGKRRPRA